MSHRCHIVNLYVVARAVVAVDTDYFGRLDDDAIGRHSMPMHYLTSSVVVPSHRRHCDFCVASF